MSAHSSCCRWVMHTSCQFKPHRLMTSCAPVPSRACLTLLPAPWSCHCRANAVAQVHRGCEHTRHSYDCAMHDMSFVFTGLPLPGPQPQHWAHQPHCLPLSLLPHTTSTACSRLVKGRILLPCQMGCGQSGFHHAKPMHAEWARTAGASGHRMAPTPAQCMQLPGDLGSTTACCAHTITQAN
jgi:hypothetical protein